MNRKTIFFSLLALMLNVSAGCSGSDDDDAKPTVDDNGRRPRMLTVTEEAGETRTTLTSENNELTAKWNVGDEVTCCNLLYSEVSGSPQTANLKAASDERVSQFTGTVTCGSGENLAIVYPVTTFSGSSSFRYTISLAGQDGTLETLAKNFHYVYGVATVTGVTGTTANATMAKMKSLLTVCKFSFVNKADSSPITVSSLDICYSYDGVGGSTDSYPQSATVTANGNPDDVHAIEAPSGAVGGASPLTVRLTPPADAVYVALLPVGSSASKRTFRFTVTASDGNTYTGKASAWLNEGGYVEATGLKLTKTE